MRLGGCLAAIMALVAACGSDGSGSVDGGGSDGGIAGGVVALYTFDETAGPTVRDVSGVAPALDLDISSTAAVEWVGGSLQVNDSTVVRSAEFATKIADAVTATNELTVEAWISPIDTSQSGAARIVSMAFDEGRHNFMLGQAGGRFEARVRTLETNADGAVLQTSDGVSKVELTHVVLTRTTQGLMRVYVNAENEGEMTVTGDLVTWDSSYRLSLANEVNATNGDRDWRGTYYRIGIYNRAFTAGEVFDRFQAGP